MVARKKNGCGLAGLCFRVYAVCHTYTLMYRLFLGVDISYTLVYILNIPRGNEPKSKENKMTQDDLLFTIVQVTNSQEEDAINLEVLRSDVFSESMFIPQLKNVFNSILRDLRDKGFITLTKTHIALTQEGFNEVWDQ